MTIDIDQTDVALVRYKLLLDPAVVYGASDVGVLRARCGDTFVDDAIMLAKELGGVAAYFNDAIKQLARKQLRETAERRKGWRDRGRIGRKQQ